MEIHLNAFSFENVSFLIRFRLSSTLKRPKTPLKTETFDNGFKSGDFWKRIVLKTLLFYCGQIKTETFETGNVKSVTCHRFQSKSEHVSKMADGFVMLTHAQSLVTVVSSFSGVFVWSTGENNTKTLVWMEIFCFIFAAMKTSIQSSEIYLSPYSLKTRETLKQQFFRFMSFSICDYKITLYLRHLAELVILEHKVQFLNISCSENNDGFYYIFFKWTTTLSL